MIKAPAIFASTFCVTLPNSLSITVFIAGIAALPGLSDCTKRLQAMAFNTVDSTLALVNGSLMSMILSAFSKRIALKSCSTLTSGGLPPGFPDSPFLNGVKPFVFVITISPFTIFHTVMTLL